MANSNNIISDLVEVDILEPDNFLKIKETLERIGIVSRKTKTVFQSCHILHKQGKYYIVHFKELFKLDGRTSDFSEEDRQRRNVIINMLEKWGLLTVINPEQVADVGGGVNVGVISYSDKKNWKLVSKYTLGQKRG